MKTNRPAEIARFVPGGTGEDEHDIDSIACEGDNPETALIRAGDRRQLDALIAALPPHVRVQWHGETPNEGVVAAMAKTDLFFLPTAGENFGHAIFEALSSGVPALISDQTPWRQLEAAKAGWDLPLAQSDRWVAAIDGFAAASSEQRAAFRRGAAEVARRWFLESGAVERSAKMLRACMAGAA